MDRMTGSSSLNPVIQILAFLLFLSISIVPVARSAVLSIDVGSEWMKVAVVNLKPGQIPISIAINEMSKRKSPALVGFSGGERLVGEEAAGIVARYPDKVFSIVRDMIGKPYEFVKNAIGSMYLPFDLVEDERGAAGIRIEDDVYTVEELMAMVLQYAMGLAKDHVKLLVRDAVITVPAYFGQAERKGMMQAAQLAGINVLALLNEHSGAALQYGIDKDFGNESRHVVFFDIGAGSTYAALVYFSAYKAKEYGKTVSVNQFQVKDIRWNTELGGQKMELRLVEYFADEFNRQVGDDGFDIRKFPKAMAKLKKQTKRTKEILSANIAAPISVESLFNDRDFRSTITREKFEEICGDLWDRALDPLKEVIKHSNLTIEEIHAVELIGGATRVPKLQNKLQELLGRKDLDKHLDADEAIVLGAALHAANLSDGIKLNRKLGMMDGSPYAFMVKLDGIDKVEQEKVEPLLVQRMKKLGSKSFRSIKHNKDFELSLSYESPDLLPPGVSFNKFAHFSILGLTETSEKHSVRNLSSPIKANLHFSLSKSGIISFDRAEAVIEYFEWVDIPKKNLTVSANISTEGESKNNTEKDEKTQTPESNESSVQSLGEISSEAAPEKKLKKKTFRVPLKIVDKPVGPGTVLSKESFSKAKLRLEALDRKDEERRRTAELKNNLEGYIYATREKLEDNDDIHKILSETERESFIQKLNEAQEWLYTDGEDASASQFKEHLDSLKSDGDPIFLRLNELTALPAACKKARSYLSGIKMIISDWEKNKSWIPNAKIEKILSEADNVKKWIEEKEALQKKASPFAAPELLSDEVDNKILDLKFEVEIVNNVRKPKIKIPSKEEKNDTTKSNSESTESSKTTDSTEDERTEETSTSSPKSEADLESESHDEL